MNYNDLAVKASKDPQALNELCKEWWKIIFNYVNKQVQCREDSEDITQNSLIKLCNNITKYDPNHDFSCWMYTIAKNTMLTHLKFRENTILLEDSEDKCNFTDKKIVLNTERIKEEINKLPEGQRQSLTLFYLEDKTFKQISEITGMPKNTIGSHLLRGKKILKQKLKDVI